MFKSSGNFDKLLDKATSLTNLEPDWASILQICDAIRQNDVQPKYALNAIKKKLFATNPNIVLMTLQVLESCIKNCGTLLHNEVGTSQFMNDLHEVLKQNSDVNVREEILRLIQALAHAFRNEPSYRAVSDKVKMLKSEGYQFAVFKESDAMFSADTAPEWADGECCHRCRVQFTMVLRKHHCRHCGQVFCAKCTTKTSTIPKFGIEKEVRVCDVCYDKINKKVETRSGKSHDSKPKATASSAPTVVSGTSSSTSAAPVAPAANKKTEQEIQEEEELQLALALSKSEAESKELERMRSYSQYNSKASHLNNISSSNSSSSSSSKHKKSTKSKSSSKSSKKSSSKVELNSSRVDTNIENEDPELARYLNREYWEHRSNSLVDYEPSPSPSAPQPSSLHVNSSKNSTVEPVESKIMQNKLVTAPQVNDQIESFTDTLRSTIEIFVNRLNSNKLRGRPITNDNGVQSLFLNLTNMHSQLIMHIQQTNEARTNFERLQDKIVQIKDSRAALDALREEHRDEMRRAAEEAERIRQQQMAQKLEIMRKKKQEYLQYQRELALQRMQEQEREMIMRTEQLKFSNSGSGPPAPSVAVPAVQWSSTSTMVPPSGGYYLPPPPNQPTYPAGGMPVQQAPAPIGPNHYVQSAIANGANMVTSHQGSTPSLMVPPPQIGVPAQQQVQSQTIQMMQPPQQQQPQQQQQQYPGQVPAGTMYVPSVPTNNFPQEVAQSVPPPATVHQYAMPVCSQTTQPPMQQPPITQAPEATEELLIKFD